MLKKNSSNDDEEEFASEIAIFRTICDSLQMKIESNYQLECESLDFISFFVNSSLSIKVYKLEVYML